MFTPQIPRAGKSDAHRSGRIKKSLAAGGALVLAVGVSVAAVPMAASAAAPLSSYAQGRFLSATLLNSDLAKLAAISAATASNDGSQASVESNNPLDVTLLNSLDVPLAGTNVNLNSLLGTANSGVVGQYAKASNDGSAIATSGAVGSDGGISTGDQSKAGSAHVNLDGLLGGAVASTIANVNLELDAISASATGSGHSADGTYRLDGAKLTFTSPAIAGLTTQVDNSLAPINANLTALTGQLKNIGLNGLGLNLGTVANVQATATVSLSPTQLTSQVNTLLTGPKSSGGITIDPGTGVVTVDLEQLQGGSLNNKPVDYELLSAAALGQITSGISSSLTGLLTGTGGVTTTVQGLLDAATVNLHITADSAILNNVIAPVTGALTGGGLAGGLGGLLGGVANGLGLPAVVPQAAAVNQLVDLSVNGTLAQLLAGGGTATATVAGLPVSASPLLATVGSVLNTSGLGGGSVSTLASTLTGLASTITGSTGLGGIFGTGTGSTSILGSVLSIRLNHQAISVLGSGAGMAVPVPTGQQFTETAVQIRLLGGSGATVNLANATVAPSLAVGTNPCTTNCGGTNPCTTNCGPGGPTPPGGLPSSPTASHASGLAYTGVGIATIIAVILALLAAGAYLAREGYRRKHLSQL